MTVAHEGDDWSVAGWRYRPEALFDLSGRAVLVTGAASGLGRAIALGCDAFGARVALADRNRAGAEAVAAALRNPSLVVEVDVTDSEAVAAMVATVEGDFGGLDAAVLMPGTNVRKPALELSDEEWSRVLDLNLSGMFHSARAVGRVMVAQGHGSMVLMAWPAPSPVAATRAPTRQARPG